MAVVAIAKSFPLDKPNSILGCELLYPTINVPLFNVAFPFPSIVNVFVVPL